MPKTTSASKGASNVPDLELGRANLFTARTEELVDIISYAASVVNDPVVSISTLELAFQELKTQFDSFIEAWKQYEPFILSNTDLHTTSSQSFRQHKREALQVLSQVTKLKDDKSVTETSTVQLPQQHRQSLPAPKLAPIEIPKFDGDISKWSAFWDIFCSLVHKRSDLEDVLKFTTLRSHLVGRAYKTIEGIPVTHANYKDAVHLLENQFGKPDRLITQLAREVEKLSVPRHQYDDLLEFKLAFEKLTLQLENLEPNYTSNAFFLETLTSKLPVETFRALANRFQRNKFTYKDISAGLSEIIELMELCKLQPQSNRKTDVVSKVAVESTSQVRNKLKSTMKPKGVLKVTSQNTNHLVKSVAASVPHGINHSPTCVCCSKNHSSKYCTKYPTFEGRRNRVRMLELCFVCMRSGHRAYDCSQKLECRHCSSTTHHTFLCIKLCQSPQNPSNYRNTNSPDFRFNLQARANSVTDNRSETKSPSTAQSSQNPSAVFSPSPSLQNQINLMNTSIHNLNTNVCQSLSVTALPTAKILLSGGGTRKVTRAFFDTGSQRTFIQRELVKELNLPVVDHVRLSVSAFDCEVKHLDCDIVKVQVRLGCTRVSIRAITHDNVNTSIHTPGLVAVASVLKSNHVNLADDYNSDVVTDIGLIIGADNYCKLVGHQHKCANIQLLSCSAGSIIFGPLPHWASQTSDTVSQTNSVCDIVCSRIAASLETEFDEISNLWKLDVVGILPETFSPEDKLTLEKFTSSIKYDDEKCQYSVDLPFKSNSLRPSLNYRKAFGQVMSLKKVIVSNPKLFEEYDCIFSDYLAQKFIEQASDRPHGHYLPYHGVRKESNTTPLRIVFNASSRESFDALSLNSCLLTGPSLTTKLCDYLIKFRTNPYAVIADISKAFLRIGINEDCRDYTKFLWFKDSTLQEIVTYRFKVVLFGATCSPFLLQRTLVHHLQSHTDPLAEQLVPHFYVDNFARTYDDIEQLFEEYPVITEILNGASMPLQTWTSNVDRFNAAVGEKDTPQNVNVLGVRWDIVDDVLSVKVSYQIEQYLEQCNGFDSKQQKLRHANPLSKRRVVSLVASLFDPLGFVSPISITAKIFIQKLWGLNLGWDTPLEQELCTEFNNWCKEISKVPTLEFPRFVIVPHKCDLHIFTDASKRAYGFAAYSVVVKSQKLDIILSKSRVAPVRDLSIPKLELTALTLAGQFASTLLGTSNLQFVSCTLWTDSQVALAWVSNNRSTDVYVRNRVSRIKENNFTINYVPTKDNPADLLTRGINFSQLYNSNLWKHGPGWLVNPSDYPSQQNLENNLVSVHELLVEPTTAEPMIPCLDVSKYSSLSRVLGILQVVLRFICSFRKKISIPLSPLHLLVKLAQQECYPTVFLYLYNNIRHNVSMDIVNFVKQLGLYLDSNNLIRTHGRLENAVMSDSMKRPILLPPKSALARLLINQCHVRNHHAGVNTVLVQIRESFWLPQARRHIKSVVNSCVHCRKVQQAPLTRPSAPPLPVERVTFHRPFQCVGVDMTGSYEVQEQDLDDGVLVQCKAYICLFTCAATRAVHLELLKNLTTGDFILAFRRFCALHSVPELIISDNATNFRGTERFIRGLIGEKEVLDHMKNQHIKWKFITPRSPWQGGFYERMIGVVKAALNKSIRRRRFSFVELQTLLCEICTVVNSRPLTYISDSPDDEYLTPNHLVYGRNIVIAPPLNELTNDEIPYLEGDDELRVQYSTLSSVLKRFTQIWVNSYLTSLRERHYGNQPSLTECPLKIVDVVLVDLDNAHRNLWPLGRVVKLFYGNDGQVRSCQVLVKNALYERPLTKIVPLEVTAEERESVTEIETERVLTLRGRPPRKAAITANAERRALIDEDLL